MDNIQQYYLEVSNDILNCNKDSIGHILQDRELIGEKLIEYVANLTEESVKEETSLNSQES